MRRVWMAVLPLFLALVALVFVLGQGQTLTVTVLAINDLHGALLPQNFSVPDPNDRSRRVSIQAGGVEALATLVKEMRARNPHTVFVGAGDLIGATPLISALLADEPTIMALNRMGMAVSALGNHEFDKGLKELQRIQRGGCQEAYDPSRACRLGTYEGARFPYIAANVLDRATGRPLFPPYVVQRVGGVEVAFVGAVLRGTPSIVPPSGIAGLDFTDEAEAINRVIPEIRARGVEAIVALVHEGGFAREPFDEPNCTSLSGPIVDIVRRLDRAVDVVVSGHTHRGYLCRVDGRLVTQADANGRLLTQIDLSIDPRTRDVVAARAANLVVDAARLAKDPEMTALVNQARAIADPIANQPVARLAVEQIRREASPAGESALGNLIADAQLAATRDPAKGGAVVAFMNPGGIRADLPPNPSPNRTVTYGDLFTVQPFGNTLVVMTLTGTQIRALLEQQFDNPEPGRNRILQVSQGFSYTWDARRPKGERVLSIRLNGQELLPDGRYRVTVNSFLAEGGDNFTVLREGTERVGGPLDLDALQAYLQAMEAAGRPAGSLLENRISAVNLP
ncbi:bifunctional UDP-sugar hydrolase/5'-nucleotidase [Meiothermus sp. QL-1]|uniref:bifunctional metallophosphatase/5'-nucleotidase n=1 Tax=Meiothermus sp. QL-1 TaxID=2058095 RepID=UPI0018F1C1A5|nr:bifunctional metallophosphatase/5'-nucleotidase [Meiothermus sp. QL-1]